MYNNLLTHLEKGILTITINRPEKLNALNFATLNELDKVFSVVYETEEIKGVVITGKGDKAFAAGADISEFDGLNDINGRKASERGQEIFDKIENCFKPVIAAVNGYALGGGCELALACHMRVLSENAVFGQPEVNLGLIPGYGGTQRLPQLIGKGRAMEILMTADYINASQAFQMGLANHVVAPERLKDQCEAILEKIFTKAPLAISMVIEAVNVNYDNQSDGYQAEANYFGHCCDTADFKEGVLAFKEKRKANFTGK